LLNPYVTNEGRVKRLKAGAMAQTEPFMSDPDLWLQNVVVPAMIRKGLITQEGWEDIVKGNIKHGIGRETMRKMSAEFTIAFSDRTGQSGAEFLATQVRKIQRDLKLFDTVMGSQ
jgi:hypothetical protein